MAKVRDWYLTSVFRQTYSITQNSTYKVNVGKLDH